MLPHEERRFKMFCQRALRLSQGKPGSLARKVAGAAGKSLSGLLNEVNLNRLRYGSGFYKLGVATLVTLCRVTRDTRPIQYILRVAKRHPRQSLEAAA